MTFMVPSAPWGEVFKVDHRFSLRDRLLHLLLSPSLTQASASLIPRLCAGPGGQSQRTSLCPSYREVRPKKEAGRPGKSPDPGKALPECEWSQESDAFILHMEKMRPRKGCEKAQRVSHGNTQPVL